MNRCLGNEFTVEISAPTFERISEPLGDTLPIGGEPFVEATRRQSTDDESIERRPPSNAGSRDFGKYRLVGQIGRGGMASVHLAVAQGHAGFQKVVVLKNMWPHLARDPHFTEMFLDEGRLLARFNHPNVVHTYDVGCEDGVYFIAMEYVEGQSLRHILRRFQRSGGFPLLAQLRILVGVLDGLHYAHTLTDFDGTPLDVVHQDVTPENILVTYDGLIKVVDFGIANCVTSLTDTTGGFLKGKLSYMAPEAVRSETVDLRADLFAVGVILWEAISRRRMWQGLGELATARHLALGEIPRLVEHAVEHEGLPPEVAEVCAKALHPHRDERYDSALAMRRALERVLFQKREEEAELDLGGLLSGRFEQERQRVRQLIDEKLGQPRSGQFKLETKHDVDASVDPDLRMLETTLRSSPRQEGEREREGLSDGGIDAPLPSNSLGPTAQSRAPSRAGRLDSIPDFRVRRGLLRKLFVASAIAIPMAALWTSDRSAQTRSSALRQAESPDFPPIAAPIQLTVRASPAHSRLYLDGVPLRSNPYVAAHACDGAPHLLSAEAPGFDPESRQIILNQDLALDIVLLPHAIPSE